MGDYSRFVRPGAVRHEVSTSVTFDPYGVMCSAYRNADGKWVAVVINYGSEPREVELAFTDHKKVQWQQYRTSDTEGENLKPVGICKKKTILPAKSITTFVATISL